MAAAPPTHSLPVATMIHMVSIKLASNNYLLWKRQVIPMLTSFHLLEFINGTVVVLSPTALSPTGEPIPNPAYTKWLDIDQRLLGVLFSTLSEEVMAEVVECTSSRYAWTTLEAVFSHSSLSRIHQLREELFSLRRGSLFVKDYGACFKALCYRQIGLRFGRKPLVSSWSWCSICKFCRCSDVYATHTVLLSFASSSNSVRSYGELYGSRWCIADSSLHGFYSSLFFQSPVQQQFFRRWWCSERPQFWRSRW